MIERSIVVGNGKVINLKDLPMGREVISSSIESLDDLEKKHITKILEKYNWNISRGCQGPECGSCHTLQQDQEV